MRTWIPEINWNSCRNLPLLMLYSLTSVLKHTIHAFRLYILLIFISSSLKKTDFMNGYGGCKHFV